MKKTLITLLTLTGVAAADTLLLSSQLAYTDAEDATKNFTISAYDTFVEQTRNYIDNYTHNGIDCFDADRLNSIGSSITLNLGAMYADGKAFAVAEGEATINSVSFIGRDDSDRRPENVTLTLNIGGVNYVSDAAVYVGNGTTHGIITFNFSNPAYVTTLGDITGTLSDGDALGVGVFKAENGAVLTGVNNGSTGWTPVAQVSMTVIPEPTTATLSLLALAGLAARRRRTSH